MPTAVRDAFGNEVLKLLDAIANGTPYTMSTTYDIRDAYGEQVLSLLQQIQVNTASASGTGSPEGVVTAVPGKFYTDLTNPATPGLWVKATGTGNTGWRELLANT